MPTPRQMEEMASRVGKHKPPGVGLASDADLPREYWQPLLDDPCAEFAADFSGQAELRLSEISRHLLRVSCRRCTRVVEIQKVDAIRLYGPGSTWRNVGQRLLNNTCTQRTGRHEEDGCWPEFGGS